ncbi:MAG TPA: hypothetical protein VK996_04970 [Ramlibacter sp.]|nr:hypothetical protein [Ramlibacter sp.]
MRELTRCIVWTLCLGALALVIAAVMDIGVAQTEGASSWLILAVYAPFYLLGHAFHADPSGWLHDPAFLAATIAVQFFYFLALVGATRYLYRGRSRRRR